MNLAGPGTGLEMMRRRGPTRRRRTSSSAPPMAATPSCAARRSAELMAALDKRMDDNIGNAGAIEFGEVFDQVAAERQGAGDAAER